MKWAWRLETLEGQIIAAGDEPWRSFATAVAVRVLEEHANKQHPERIPGAVIRLERRP